MRIPESVDGNRRFRVEGSESEKVRFLEATRMFREFYWQDKPFTDAGFIVSTTSDGGRIISLAHDTPRGLRDVIAIAKALAFAAGCTLMPFEEGADENAARREIARDLRETCAKVQQMYPDPLAAPLVLRHLFNTVGIQAAHALERCDRAAKE